MVVHFVREDILLKGTEMLLRRSITIALFGVCVLACVAYQGYTARAGGICYKEKLIPCGDCIAGPFPPACTGVHPHVCGAIACAGGNCPCMYVYGLSNDTVKRYEQVGAGKQQVLQVENKACMAISTCINCFLNNCDTDEGEPLIIWHCAQWAVGGDNCP